MARAQQRTELRATGPKDLFLECMVGGTETRLVLHVNDKQRKRAQLFHVTKILEILK